MKTALIFLVIIVALVQGEGENCTASAEQRVTDCLLPILKIAERISGTNPAINLLAFPLFSFEKTDIVEICDAYQNVTNNCLIPDNLESVCPNHVLWTIFHSLFGHACGEENSEQFVKNYQCIHDTLAGKKECVEGMRVPAKPEKTWNKCERAPALYKCIGSDLATTCGEEAVAMFEDTLTHSGCKEFRKAGENVRRRPVSTAALQMMKDSGKMNETTAANCTQHPDCNKLYQKYEERMASKGNITFPLFVFSKDDIEEICADDLAPLDSCVCDDSDSSKIAKTMVKLCKDPGVLANSYGCLQAISEKRSRCLSLVRYESGVCEGNKEFDACVRIMAVTEIACRRNNAIANIFDATKSC